VYKITQQDLKNSKYVAEDPGTRSSTHEVLEPINIDLDDLARSMLRELLYYLQSQGYDQVAKSEDLYMSLSFNPICQRIMRYGEIYFACPLSEAEQDKFCNDLKQLYKRLDDIIDDDGTALDGSVESLLIL